MHPPRRNYPVLFRARENKVEPLRTIMDEVVYYRK